MNWGNPNWAMNSFDGVGRSRIRDNTGRVIVLIILLAIVYDFFACAATLALIVWGLKTLGIFIIDTWTVAFSWKTTLLFFGIKTLITIIVKLPTIFNKKS